jgi:hypothetical protein
MKPLSKIRRGALSRRLGPASICGVIIVLLANRDAQSQTRADLLELPDGQRVTGHLAGDSRTGIGFTAAQASAPVPLESGSVVQFNGSGPTSLASTPPFRVLIGETLRLSGTLRGISQRGVRLGLSWDAPDVALPRPGVEAVVQRPGEARVLVDGFETLEKSRWAIVGKPELVAAPHFVDEQSLRLPAGGTSLVHALAEPIAAGRFDLAFLDDGAVVAGQLWSIELLFQGSSGVSATRVLLGWAEESLAVESPNGLAVQRLARTPGWHRFSLRFSPTQTEVSVDGKELAHGKGPDGPLVTIRLASSAPAQAVPPPGLAGHFDDLQLIRFAEPPDSFELDVAQDEARLVMGDQLYGEIKQSDGERVNMTVDGEPISLAWSDVSGLYFRCIPARGNVIEGLLARLEWRTSPGEEPDNVDFAEGAIQSVSDKAVTLATPYAGVLSIPRERVRKLVVRGHGRRLLIDQAAHHLGDEYSATAPLLNPRQPEGDRLERAIELTEIPDQPCFLVLDVFQLVGEDNDPRWSQRIREGELRTYVAINGKRIDYLNRYVKKSNDVPEQIAVPIPKGALKRGKNTIRLELTGMATKEKELDDFGLLQMALEFRSSPSRGQEPKAETGPP